MQHTNAENSVAQEIFYALKNRKIDPKYFYDARGCELFEQITALKEYYPTRCELEILRNKKFEIAANVSLGKPLTVVELGAGATNKIEALLSGFKNVKRYVPIDVAQEAIETNVTFIRKKHPQIICKGIQKSFFDLAKLEREPGTHMLVFFPGSTIGNMDPMIAQSFLARLRSLLEPEDAMLIGVDLVKSHTVLEPAYNDSQNVTAAFNLNVLERFNREVGSNFDVKKFRHKAVFNKELSRIEMYLEALEEQTVQLPQFEGKSIQFKSGELIHTENSYKYSIEKFQNLAECAGLMPEKYWTDSRDFFSLHLLRVTEPC